MEMLDLSTYQQIMEVRRDAQSKDRQLQTAQQQVLQYMHFIYCP